MLNSCCADTANRIAKEVRQQVLEEACKVMCGYCSASVPALIAGDVWEHDLGSVNNNMIFVESCQASAIRDLMEQE